MTTKAQKNNDTMLKIIALICALLLWFYAEAQENPSKERQLTVPIQYTNVAADIIVEQGPQSIQLTIKGNETNIMSLRSDDFTAVVDLSNAVLGTGTYPVQVTSSAVVDKFTYTPDKVSVTIDQIEQKTVPVQLRTEGALSPYYEMQSIEVQPDAVVIRGKRSVLSEIYAIETVPIDISGIDADKELIGMLVLPEGVTAQTDGTAFHSDVEVAVYLYVQPIQEIDGLHVMVVAHNVPEGLSAVLEPATANVMLHDGAETLDVQAILEQVTLYVDCAELTLGTHTVPLQISTSNEAVAALLDTVSPQYITITLSNAAIMIDEIEQPSNGIAE